MQQYGDSNYIAMSLLPLMLSFLPTSIALPNVITPTRPIYIKRIKTTLLSIVMSHSMPDVNPAVANADTASNDIFRKSASFGSNSPIRYMPTNKMKV